MNTKQHITFKYVDVTPKPVDDNNVRFDVLRIEHKGTDTYTTKIGTNLSLTEAKLLVDSWKA